LTITLLPPENKRRHKPPQALPELWGASRLTCLRRSDESPGSPDPFQILALVRVFPGEIFDLMTVRSSVSRQAFRLGGLQSLANSPTSALRKNSAKALLR